MTTLVVQVLDCNGVEVSVHMDYSVPKTTDTLSILITMLSIVHIHVHVIYYSLLLKMIIILNFQ